MQPRATYEVTIKHPNGSQRIVRFDALSMRTARIKAKGIDRLWAEQVVLDSIRLVG